MVRWNGFISSSGASFGCCNFYVSTKLARLWIDGILIIDVWNQERQKQSLEQGFYPFNNSDLKEIILETRDVTVGLSVKLLWSSGDSDAEVIPSSSLFWQSRILDH